MSGNRIPSTIQIGTRVQIGKDRATVKFVGAVKNTEGEWLGIEWDDAQRGKHDGKHEDIQYFTCSYPTSGSFVRYQAKKVLAGISFMTALRDKYLDENDETSSNVVKFDKEKDRGELYWGGNKQIVVETYGFGKIQNAQRQLNKLKVVGLAELQVSSSGPKDEIKDAGLDVEDVDLSRNLISSWETISEIVSQLPSLQILRLNQLILKSPPSVDLNLLSLRTIALNHTNIAWREVELLANSIPQIENLQLGGNRISRLGKLNLENLSNLNLEDNDIDDWYEIEKLGASLPKLETLFLNNNKIVRIEKPSTNEMFANLKVLRIEENKIDNWDSIDALNQSCSLTKLRCKNNPVFKDLEPELEATQIVGRIKNLTNVNGNTASVDSTALILTNRQRIDLERFYIKLCIKDGSTHEQIALIHPRYKELCSQHGEPDLHNDLKEAPSTLKSRLLTVNLTMRDISTVDDIKSKKDLPVALKDISKRFLPTMTIRNVKHMIQKLWKIPSARQKLFLIQSSNEENRDLIVMDLTDELRDLKFYGISDGDEISVTNK